MLEEYEDNIVIPFLPKENVGDEIRSTETPRLQKVRKVAILSRFIIDQNPMDRTNTFRAVTLNTMQTAL